tara:strand:+ start:608 stop:1333 length:726 start_codon:yes stop_codon:yes gene_type:complete
MNLKTALILAGGKGTRLIEHTKDLPKPLVPIRGIPLLKRIILWLKKNGIENIILGVAYKKEMIINYFKDGSSFGLKIDYVEHDENGGTGDAFREDIKQALEKKLIQEENFYAMNGDQITDLQLKDFTNNHLKTGAFATILTVKMKTNLGIVESDSGGKITKFQEKWEIPEIHINAGIYIFNKKIVEYLVGGNIEETTFRTLSKEGKIRAFFYDGIWITVNDRKELKKMEDCLKKFDPLKDA